jgi:hypothetical protein
MEREERHKQEINTKSTSNKTIPETNVKSNKRSISHKKGLQMCKSVTLHQNGHRPLSTANSLKSTSGDKMVRKNVIKSRMTERTAVIERHVYPNRQPIKTYLQKNTKK